MTRSKKVKQQNHQTTYLEGLIHRWSCERRHEHHSSWNALWHRNHHIWAGPVGEASVLDPLDQPLLDEIDYEKYSLIAMISLAEKWCLTLIHVKRIVDLKKVQILIMYWPAKSSCSKFYTYHRHKICCMIIRQVRVW